MRSEKKIKKLRHLLRGMKRVVVAYSGGVDSTFLLKAAVDTLGRKNVLAVTAESPTFTKSESKDAKRFAKKIKARHIIIWTEELRDKNFKVNPKNRCYYCKSELFGRLQKIAQQNNIKFVLDASNRDDLSDYRPGSKAAKECGIKSPLKNAGFTKKDIRAASKRLRLPSWNKPAMACLASRLPYGEHISDKKLRRIEQAEELLYSLGFSMARVRSHGDIARIEIPVEQIKLLNKRGLRDRIVGKLKRLGFTYITVDLEGYRTGSMNEVLK